MIAPRYQAQLDYAAQTNAAVRVALAEIELLRLEIAELRGPLARDAVVQDLEERLDAALATVAKLTELIEVWKGETLAREQMVREAMAERDDAIDAFTKAGAV